MDEQQNPFESRAVRGAIGLSSGLIIAMVALFYFEGTMRLLLIGFAAVDALATPFFVKKATEQQQDGGDPTA